MTEWVEKNGTYTYTDDEYIAVVSPIEYDGDNYYGYEIYENNENRDIAWSSVDELHFFLPDGIGYYDYFPQEAMDKAKAIINEFEGR